MNVGSGTADFELGTYTLDELGGAGSIIAAELTGNTGGATLTGSNAIASLGNFSAGGGNFTLDNTQALSITGTLNVGSGTADFELGTNTLDESGGAGSIIAAGLTGNTGGATLTGSNAIASLGNFNTGGGDFTLENMQALSITGTLNVGSGTADFELGTHTLDKSGGAGSILAAGLTGNTGGAILTGSNAIASLGNFNTSGGNFTLDNTQALSITGTLNVGSGTADFELGTNTLDESGGAGSILAAELTGNTGRRDADGFERDRGASGISTPAAAILRWRTCRHCRSTGALNVGTGTADFELGTNTLDESGGAGSIIAAGLTGNTGGATLTGSNAIASLGNFNTGGGNFTLDNTQALSISGVLNAGAGTADFELGSNTLDKSGGAIDAAVLTGNTGGATLTGLNAIASLGNLNTGGGNFTLDNTQALSITGSLNLGTGTADFELGADALSESGGAIDASLLTGNTGGATLIGANAIASLGNFNTFGGSFTLQDTQALVIVGSLAAASGAVDFELGANGLAESGGSIQAARLTGNAGIATLTASGNRIADLDAFSAARGFSLTDSTSLTVAGAVDSGTGNLALTTTGTGSALTIAANLTAGTPTGGQSVALVSADALTQTGGVITAGQLTGSAAATMSLAEVDQLGSLGAVSAGNGFSLTDDPALVVSGTIDAGTGNLTLTTTNSDLILDAESGGGGGDRHADGHTGLLRHHHPDRRDHRRRPSDRFIGRRDRHGRRQPGGRARCVRDGPRLQPQRQRGTDSRRRR